MSVRDDIRANNIQKINRILTKSNHDVDKLHKIFMIAAEEGNAEVVERLLQDPRIDPGVRDNYAIRKASKKGNVDVVRVLLQDPRVDPSADISYTIREASRGGHFETVKLLLENGRARPEALNNFPLKIAVLRGHDEVVKLLLTDPRVDPTVDNYYLIDRAIQGPYNNNIELAKILLSSPLVDLNIVMEKAFEKEDTKVLEYLAQHPRLDPTFNNSQFVRWAAESGYSKIVRLLLKNPRVNPREHDDDALYTAMDNDHTEIVEMLESDKEKFPNYIIRLNNVPLENQIQEIEAVISGFRKEEEMFINVYEEMQKVNTSSHNIQQQVVTFQLQKIGAEIGKLQDRVNLLRREQERFYLENL